MKLNKKHIPFYAAIVQTAQYALAGYFLIGPMGWFFVGLMGALVSVSMAYAASQYADIAQKRKAGSMVALVALMAMSPVLIGTATFLHLEQITNLYWRGVVSAVWGIIPDGAVVLAGFIAGKGLVDNGEKPAKSQRKPKAKPIEPAPEPEKPAFICTFAGCSAKPFGSQSALNAHQRKHKQIVGYLANFEPVTREVKP